MRKPLGARKHRKARASSRREPRKASPSSNLPIYSGASAATGVIDGSIVAGAVAVVTGQPFSFLIFGTVGAFAAFIAFAGLAVCSAAGGDGDAPAPVSGGEPSAPASMKGEGHSSQTSS